MSVIEISGENSYNNNFVLYLWPNADEKTIYLNISGYNVETTIWISENYLHIQFGEIEEQQFFKFSLDEESDSKNIMVNGDNLFNLKRIDYLTVVK